MSGPLYHATQICFHFNSISVRLANMNRFVEQTTYRLRMLTVQNTMAKHALKSSLSFITYVDALPFKKSLNIFTVVGKRETDAPFS